MPAFFTQEELAIAKDTDLPDLLSSLGYQVKRVGNYHTVREMDSLRVKNRRSWFRYSEGIGGDAIAFVQHFCQKSFPEAVDYLLDFQGGARSFRASPPVSRREPVPFVLPPPAPDHRRVTAYLQKRGIAPQVIRDFIAAGLLYEEAAHHNCVFVGKNSAGQPVFAAMRGTYDQNGAAFRGGVPGSDKDTGFRLPCPPEQLRVFVFEAPIDLMSLSLIHI